MEKQVLDRDGQEIHEGDSVRAGRHGGLRAMEIVLWEPEYGQCGEIHLYDADGPWDTVPVRYAAGNCVAHDLTLVESLTEPVPVADGQLEIPIDRAAFFSPLTIGVRPVHVRWSDPLYDAERVF